MNTTLHIRKSAAVGKSDPAKGDYLSGWLEGHATGQRTSNAYYFMYGIIAGVVGCTVLVLVATFWR